MRLKLENVHTIKKKICAKIMLKRIAIPYFIYTKMLSLSIDCRLSLLLCRLPWCGAAFFF